MDNPIIKLLIKTGIIVGITVIVCTFFIGIYPVHTNSMYPMLKDGDLVITNKLQTPSFNDVVAYETETGELSFSRVIAASGTEVSITEGGLSLNGSPVTEDIFYETKPAPSGTINYPYAVLYDNYFLLNDFRQDTRDSREFGEVNKDKLKGSVIFILRRRSF